MGPSSCEVSTPPQLGNTAQRQETTVGSDHSVVAMQSHSCTCSLSSPQTKILVVVDGEGAEVEAEEDVGVEAEGDIVTKLLT